MSVPKTPLLVRLWSSVWVVCCAALVPYIIAIVTCVIRLTRHSRRPGNLHTFRDAAIALSHGQNLYRSGTGDYLYPPLVAFFAQPLGWISLDWAAVLMLVINTVVAVITLKIVVQELLSRLTGKQTVLMVARVALITAWLSTDHIRTEFNEWETNVWMLLLFVLALRWADRRPIWAGIALGAAFNIKFLPIVFVPYLIVRRRWAILAAFVASIFLFAFLPAVSMGWSKDVAALSESYAGIARVVGVHVAAANAANDNPFTSDKSVSMLSFVGRATGFKEVYSMAIAGGIGVVLLLLWAILYRRNGFKLQWGNAQQQLAQPYRGLFAVEFPAIILLALLFSPYTNSAHLYMLLAINAAVSVMLVYGAKGVNRWPLLIAALVMFFGTILPPGGGDFRHAELISKELGTTAWCMSLLFIALIWTGIKHVRQMARDT